MGKVKCTEEKEGWVGGVVCTAAQSKGLFILQDTAMGAPCCVKHEVIKL